MGKSILNYFNKQKKEDQKDLQNRGNQFMAEYKVIRARYRCDFQAYLHFKDNGQGGIFPALRTVDATKKIEEEEKAEKLKAEAIEKQKLEAEKNKENQGSGK